ncbi:MAG: mobilization protein [Ruminiclostridium sp.]|nr:mobilization protein [Ruminiclostridium sp.]
MEKKTLRKRNNQFAIRLSDSELALWNSKQSASGMGKTEFFLKMLKSTRIKVYSFNESLKLLYNELRHIGGNLNQAAYLVNVDRFDVAAREIDAMYQEFMNMMNKFQKFIDNPMINATIIEVPTKKDGD